MVPQAILKGGEEEGEKEFRWWYDLFKEDFYVEIQRHGIPEQDLVNDFLVKFARKYNVPIIASNDSHYIDQDDADTHDTLLCVSTSANKSTPKRINYDDEEESAKGGRFAFFNDQFFFKSTAQMLETFSDLPEAIDNTNIIVDKVVPYKLKKDIALPRFPIPEPFTDEFEYLKVLTEEGAKIKYPIITPEVDERIKFELGVIKTMGFPGYFLIVSDFIKWAKNNGVYVGPGRGSAAGSVVAYCIDITNVDPVKYGLLFERFLNPDRASMPDIDTDFDDEGRQSVIDYVVGKYGENRVAQIITFNTMAAKSSIKDVARVMELPLDRSNFLAKLVPDKPGTVLKRVLQAPLRGSEDSLEKKDNLQEEDLKNIQTLRDIYKKTNDLESTILHDAEKLEGNSRSVGTHAAGIIIAPENLSNLIPVCKTKDSKYLVTQFEGNIIEDAGVIKMDFLGLKNLTILKEAIAMIKLNHYVDIVLDDIPLDDEATYQLYQAGATNGTFQFESAGMQKHLLDLKPDCLEDLIAMNALYRPGPLAYIPEFIERKHGRKEITYDIPDMEETLKETYGITVYQEQVMLLSQKLANFTKGDADKLRKAMGKKQRDVLDKLKPQFIDGCISNGHDAKVSEKVWKDWEAFAEYAFNKSHSTCYAIVAYHTAYLKANYPCEYMSALLNNTGATDRITFYMDECKAMGIEILGPDVNESRTLFAVSRPNVIRFGLGAIKNVGVNAVEDIIKIREESGPFTDVFNFMERVPCKSLSKRNLEFMIDAGALDVFTEMHRAQYFHSVNGDIMNLEKLIRYANAFQNNNSAMSNSLFGDIGGIAIARPKMDNCEEFGLMEKLNKEKFAIGMYLTGHPLDAYKFEIDNYNITPIETVKNPLNYGKGAARIAGFVSSSRTLYTKKGDEFGILTLSDYTDNLEIALFGNDYINNKKYFIEGEKYLVVGSFEKRKWQKEGEEEKFEFRVQQIIPLSEVKQLFSKRLHVQISMESLTDEFIDELIPYLINNPGKMEITFEVVDKVEGNPFKFKAFNKVNFTEELLEHIKSLADVKFKISPN
jgi:DNA polymerase III subunit alpha